MELEINTKLQQKYMLKTYTTSEDIFNLVFHVKKGTEYMTFKNDKSDNAMILNQHKSLFSEGYKNMPL